jgi:transposase
LRLVGNPQGVKFSGDWYNTMSSELARKLKPDDEIVIEATGNTSAIVRVLLPFVGRVAIANPILVRAIAWAKVKTDKIDAAVLAKLHASGFLPEVWMPDEETEARRRVVAERTQLVSQMTRLKNRIQSVLHANLIPPYKGVLFSQRGRAWLEAQPRDRLKIGGQAAIAIGGDESFAG